MTDTNLNLRDLITSSGENAEAKGFHDTGNTVRTVLSALPTTKGGGVLLLGDRAIELSEKFWQELYAAYQGNRLFLAVSELVEANEEIRNGKPYVYAGEGGKPEGVAVELGDVQIRLADYAFEFNVPLVEAIQTKAVYNKGRERMHGGKLT